MANGILTLSDMCLIISYFYDTGAPMLHVVVHFFMRAREKGDHNMGTDTGYEASRIYIRESEQFSAFSSSQ